MASSADGKGRSGGHGGIDVTYAPLDILKPIAPDVWIVDSGPVSAYGMPMPVRMTVIRLNNGDLLLHSPTRYIASLHAELEQLGRIRHLVAPNIAHWIFAGKWRHAIPGTQLWAAPKLAGRLAVRRARLPIDRELGPQAPAEWSGEIEHVIIPGAGFCEVAIFHKKTATLVLTDTVINLEPNKLPTIMALLMKLGGSASPHGGAPFYLRAAIFLKWRAGKAAVERLLAMKPARVIFAHGAWFDEDATPRLRRSFRWLIGDNNGLKRR